MSYDLKADKETYRSDRLDDLFYIPFIIVYRYLKKYVDIYNAYCFCHLAHLPDLVNLTLGPMTY